jgi:hypothetical protein
MKHTLVSIALLSAPAFLTAQGSSERHAAAAPVNLEIPATYSDFARQRIVAAFRNARMRHVPDDQMRRRLAEGQARGATDVQVASVIQRTEVRLEEARALLLHAGAANPQPDEITNVEQALEHGVSEAQIVAAVQNPPPEMTVRSALEALARPGIVSAGEVVSKKP